MNHEEHVREAGAEVSAVGVVMTRRFRSVNVHAFRTIQFHHRFACSVRRGGGGRGSEGESARERESECGEKRNDKRRRKGVKKRERECNFE